MNEGLLKALPMNILMAANSKIPALKCGGTERIAAYLGQELKKPGNKVTFLAAEGSRCSLINSKPPAFLPETVFKNESLLLVQQGY